LNFGLNCIFPGFIAPAGHDFQSVLFVHQGINVKHGQIFILHFNCILAFNLCGWVNDSSKSCTISFKVFCLLIGTWITAQDEFGGIIFTTVYDLAEHFTQKLIGRLLAGTNKIVQLLTYHSSSLCFTLNCGLHINV
jgi:hypothetical protein